MTQKIRPDEQILNFPVNANMSPAHGESLTYHTGTSQWTNEVSSGLPVPFALTADITPTALTASVNDYEPPGGGAADVWRLSTDGSPYNITGLAGGADGRILILHNVDASQDITLVDESASSAAANRFDFVTDIVIRQSRSVVLIYDSTASRWKLLASGDADALRGVPISANLGSIADDDTLYYNGGDGNIQSTSRAGYIFNDSEGDPADISAAADGTSTYAARRDHVHAITNGSAVLASSFTITGASGVFQDTGLSVTLPSAGTYKITCNARTQLIGNAGVSWWIVLKLYNSTDAADVADSVRMGAITGNAGRIGGTTPIDIIITVAASKTINLYAERAGSAGASWTESLIVTDSNGTTTMMYEKIG